MVKRVAYELIYSSGHSNARCSHEKRTVQTQIGDNNAEHRAQAARYMIHLAATWLLVACKRVVSKRACRLGHHWYAPIVFHQGDRIASLNTASLQDQGAPHRPVRLETLCTVLREPRPNN